MFTGLVEAVGQIAGRHAAPYGASFSIRATFVEPFVRGESISVSGACLTVVEHAQGVFAIDLTHETLARTTLGVAKPGDSVNLERALRLGDRLGGHMVTGHVDGIGQVVTFAKDGGAIRLDIAVPTPLLPLVAEKGSIAVDGVSLTVNRVDKDVVGVLLIPETLRNTTLRTLEVGLRVNLEMDLLARYAARLLHHKVEISRDEHARWEKKLRDGGFM